MTKEEILATLNEEQRQAVVDYTGSMAVEAGPGSGKGLYQKRVKKQYQSEF